jgi:hypothetical protein
VQNHFDRFRTHPRSPLLGIAALASLALGCGTEPFPELFDGPTPNMVEYAAKLRAIDPGSYDRFGDALALDGDTIAVGARRDDGACPSDIRCNSGSVQIHGRNGGGMDTWGDAVLREAMDAQAGDEFGTAVALSGDTLAVGAPGDDTACATDPDCDSGSVYIFERDFGGPGAWGQAAKITASGPMAGDEFGWTLALAGDTLVVGSPGDDAVCPADPDCDSGAAYVYERDLGGAGAWGEALKIAATDAAAGDYFGFAVALAGDSLVVGAPSTDTACPADPDCDSGSAYVFERDFGGAGAWGERTRIDPDGAGAGDYAAYAVAIDADTIALGAPFDDIGCAVGPNCWSGVGYVFGRDLGAADAWGQAAKLVTSDLERYDEAGISVAISGDVVALGAHGDNEAGENAGAAHFFARDEGGAGGWGETDKIIPIDGRAYDQFGLAVELEGATAVIGAKFDDDPCYDSCNTGSAYVFDRN